MFEWDPEKDALNRTKHGVGFAAVWDFSWEHALLLTDDRQEYGECRQRAFGLLAGKLHALVFTLRDGNIRIISLRRANKREEKRYAALKES